MNEVLGKSLSQLQDQESSVVSGNKETSKYIPTFQTFELASALPHVLDHLYDTMILFNINDDGWIIDISYQA